MFRHYEAELQKPDSIHFEKTKYITEVTANEAREHLQKIYGITPHPSHVYGGSIDISQSTVFSEEQRNQDEAVKKAFEISKMLKKV